MKILLDSGPLGKLCNPLPRADILAWQRSLSAAGWTLIVPEITDFEVRRNLILERKIESIACLNHLKGLLVYQPITTTTMLEGGRVVGRRPPPRGSRRLIRKNWMPT